LPRIPAIATADPLRNRKAAVRVLRKLRLVFNTVKSHFREVEKRAGLAGAQVWALSVLKEQPGISLGELARALDIRQSTASNLVKPLVQLELVKLTRDSKDRRTVQLRITPRAQAVLRKAPPPLTGVLPDALVKLSPETLKGLDRNLADLISMLDADKATARIPLGSPEH
jgi:DNA-binding MarR family transcriptional regulator